MNQTTIKKLSLVLIATLACGTLMAQNQKMSGAHTGPRVPMRDAALPPAAPFYSNLVVDACTACNYSADNGYLVLGPNNCGLPGSTQWLAYDFVAGHTGTTRQLSLAITDWSACLPTTHKFTVQIMGDNCTNAPDTTNVLGTGIGTAPTAPCLLATARLAAPLTIGVKYWVVVTTSAATTQNATTAVWWEANTAWADYNLNDGNGWIAFPAGSPGAFAVQ